MRMLPIIMNTSFQKLCVIDDYISFIWTTRYYSPGDFELCLDVSSKNFDFIYKDYYVMRDDSDEVGIIETIKIQLDEDAHEIMIVSGRFLTSIIGRRIVEKQTEVSGTIANCILKLLNDNAISPTAAARRIPNLSFRSLLSDAVTMKAQYTGDNLLETIEKICETYGYGFRMVLTETNGFEFQLYSGVDRSYNQSVNPWVIFSDTYDNLLSSDYEENYANIVTDVLVAGEGEGLDRKTIWAAKNSQSGLDRYELYKDFRNASTNDGEISDSEYYAQLTQDGLESVTEITQAFAGQVYFGGLEYKKDVNIGDICVIENARWFLSINTRLIEVIESTSETGEYTVTPTFGI